MYKGELLIIIGIVLIVITVHGLLIKQQATLAPICTVTDLGNKEIVVCKYKDKVLFNGELEK